MLVLIGDYLAMKQINYLKLDGETPNAQRQVLIDKFNEQDQRVFLLSTKAGGLGLNLTQADTVFIMDSDYNPHND
jgi:chromodomain-helicase-DNA-binding protein 1